jgi:hypothetical protein
MMAHSRIGMIGAGLTFSTHLRDQLDLTRSAPSC